MTGSTQVPKKGKTSAKKKTVSTKKKTTTKPVEKKVKQVDQKVEEKNLETLVTVDVDAGGNKIRRRRIKDPTRMFTKIFNMCARIRKSEKVPDIHNLVDKIVPDLKVIIEKLKESMTRKKSTNKKLSSGFDIKIKISDELRKFMKVKAGMLVSRNEVTKFMCEYIKDKKLQSEKDKRQIVPDDSMKKLFELKKGENINYCLLQKLLTRHYPKSIKASK